MESRGEFKMTVLRRGAQGDDVKALQTSLVNAGYRVATDGVYGPRTYMVVRQFQQQHHLDVDGIAGPLTLTTLAVPPARLIAAATPLVNMATGWPHDDTASLNSFYGNPGDSEASQNAWMAKYVVGVRCPWTLFYDGQEWPHPIQLHKRSADAYAEAFNTIWKSAGEDNNSPILKHVRNFSGSGNFRVVRGSTRRSTHFYYAAIDYDANRLPMGPNGVPETEMPEEVVAAFDSVLIFWGNRYKGRRDPMHFQAAHE